MACRDNSDRFGTVSASDRAMAPAAQVMKDLGSPCSLCSPVGRWSSIASSRYDDNCESTIKVTIGAKFEGRFGRTLAIFPC